MSYKLCFPPICQNYIYMISLNKSESREDSNSKSHRSMLVQSTSGGAQRFTEPHLSTDRPHFIFNGFYILYLHLNIIHMSRFIVCHLKMQLNL
jgi:hypothetical protein